MSPASSRQGSHGPEPSGSGPPEPKSSHEVIVAAAIVLVLAAALVPLPGYGAQARTLPLVVGVPTLLLAIANLVRVSIRARHAAGDRRSTSGAPAVGARPLAAIAWTLGAGALVLVLGFLVGALIYLPLFMWLYGRQPPLRILLVTLGILGPLYIVFVRLLDVAYYPGLVG